MSSTEVELQMRSHILLSPRSDDQQSARSPQGVNENASRTEATTAILDGGSGRIVVVSSTIITFWMTGIANSWGVMQAALFDQGLSSASTLSWVGSLSITCAVALALLSNRFLRIFGGRFSSIFGVLLLSLGEIFSGSTTKDVGGLFRTTGVVLGTGASLCYMVANTISAQYFSAKLGLANGIVKAGGGAGGAVLALAGDALIRKLGIGWTFRIFGFLTCAMGLPAAWFMRERQAFRPTAFVDFAMFNILSLWRPVFYLPLFAQSIGLPSTTGAWLVAAFNLCSTVGRLGSGVLCDRIGAANTFLLTWLINAATLFAIWPLSSSLAPLLIFATLNGMANGSFFTVMPTVVAMIFGTTRAAVAMSMTVTGWSAGYLMGAPIAGHLLQAMGGQKQGTIKPYFAAVFYAGGISSAAFVFVLLARLKMEKKLVKKI